MGWLFLQISQNVTNILTDNTLYYMSATIIGLQFVKYNNFSVCCFLTNFTKRDKHTDVKQIHKTHH